MLLWKSAFDKHGRLSRAPNTCCVIRRFPRAATCRQCLGVGGSRRDAGSMLMPRARLPADFRARLRRERGAQVSLARRAGDRRDEFPLVLGTLGDLERGPDIRAGADAGE